MCRIVYGQVFVYLELGAKGMRKQFQKGIRKHLETSIYYFDQCEAFIAACIKLYTLNICSPLYVHYTSISLILKTRYHSNKITGCYQDQVKKNESRKFENKNLVEEVEAKNQSQKT